MEEIDKKILEFLDLLVQHKIIKYKTQFYRQIKFKVANIDGIRKGRTHFTVKNIIALKYYNINYNWLLGSDILKFIGNNLPKQEYHNVVYHFNSEVTA